MWVSSTSPPNFSLIDPTEIYYQTEKTGNTETHTQTKSDTFPI